MAANCSIALPLFLKAVAVHGQNAGCAVTGTNGIPGINPPTQLRVISGHNSHG
jgi:hypothetical protein